MRSAARTSSPSGRVALVGSTVSFPNSDSVSHQICSFSPTKRFQLPLYRGKPYAPVPFDHVGVVILGCNIHDWMIGYIDVTDAPFYGATDDRGSCWTVTLEWLRVTSSSYSRGEYLDRSGPITDTQAQLSVRYALGSSPY